MQQDVFKVISVVGAPAFEAALNEAGSDGFKIVPLTTTIKDGLYECIMGKTITAEQAYVAEAREAAKKAGLFVPENFGV